MLKRLFACLAIIAALTHHCMAQVTFNTGTTCSAITLSNGNLTASFVAPPGAGDVWIAPVNSLIPIGSKVYFEFVQSSFTTGGGGSNLQIGAMNLFYNINCGTNSFPGDGQFVAASGFVEDNKGQVVTAGSFVATIAPWTTVGSNVSVALDLANKKFWARVNGGNWNNDILANQNPATNTGGIDISPNVTTSMIPFVDFRDSGGGTMTGNFASSSWTFSAPAGFSQLPVPTLFGVAGLKAIGGANKGISGSVSSGLHCDASCVVSVTYNMITDFGATCNGTGDDAPFFGLAHNVIVQDPRVLAGANVTVTIPPGSNCILNSCSSSNFATGMNDLTIVATGATLNGAGGGCSQWGNGNIVSGINPPIQTVSAGANCVTTITPVDAANFGAGRYAMLNGMGLQGSGFPPNYGLWEYVRVQSSNSTTGQVCFDTNLVNSYKSTWVDLGATNCAGTSCGANGRLQLMTAAWAHTITFIGGTWEFWATPIFYTSRNVIAIGTTWVSSGHSNPNCFTPTFSGTITFTNVTITNCGIEADKEVDNWIVDNSTIDTFFQSASFHTMTINNNSSVANIFGTPQHLICNNSTIAGIAFGNSIGNPLSFSGTNCHITGNITNDLNNPGECSAMTQPSCRLLSVSSGVFTINHAGGGFDVFSPPTWWVPGTVMEFIGNNGRRAGSEFTVLDNFCGAGPGGEHGAGGALGCSGGTVTVSSTFPGSAFPPITGDPTLGIQIKPDILRDWACSNCDGSAKAIDLSQAPAQHQPLWTYSNRTYTCTNNIVNVPNSLDLNSPPGYNFWGNFVSVTINVSRADTSGLGTLTVGTDQFGQLPITNQVTGAFTGWGYGTNLKIAGTRTITPTAVTGGQSGDTGTFPGANSWVGAAGGSGIFTSADLTAEPAGQCPVVTFTFQASR